MIEYVECVIEKFSELKNKFIPSWRNICKYKIKSKNFKFRKCKYCYVFPNMGDGGLGAGCALDVNFKYNYMSVKNKQTMSLGSHYPSLKET